MPFHDEAADWLKERLAKVRAAERSRPTHPETRRALPPPSVKVSPAPSYPHQPASQVDTAFRRRTGRDPAPPRAPVRQLPTRPGSIQSLFHPDELPATPNVARFLQQGGIRPDQAPAVPPPSVQVTPAPLQDRLQWDEILADAFRNFETLRTTTNLVSPGAAQIGRGRRQHERLSPEQQQQIQEGAAFALSGPTPIAGIGRGVGAILGRAAPVVPAAASVAGRTVPPLLKLGGRAAKGFVSGGTKTAAPLVAQDLLSSAQ